MAGILGAAREEILRRWRLHRPAERAPGRELEEAIAGWLDEVIDRLEGRHVALAPGAGTETGAPWADGGDAEEGLYDRLLEFRTLQEAVFDYLDEIGWTPNLHEFRILGAALGEGLAGAALGWVAAHRFASGPSGRAAPRDDEVALFFDRMPEVFAVIGYDGRIVRLNSAVEQVLGWKPEELVGRSAFDLVHPDDRAAVLREHERITSGATIIQFEDRYRTRDGGWRILAWAARPFPERGVVYAAARDMTGIRRRHDELEAALALLDSVIATAPVGIGFFDRQLRFVRVNERLAEINRRPAEEQLGRTLVEVLPEVGAKVVPVIEQVFAHGGTVRDVEVTQRTPEGQERHVLKSIFPVKDRRGRIFMVGEVVVDVTDRKNTEEAMRRAAEFRERFIGIVAHDLRTPLAAISSGAYLLQRMEGLPERAVRIATRLESSAARMSRMIGDLLDFTRVRLGSGIPVERRWIDLVPLVRQAVEEAESAHPGRRIEVDGEGDFRGNWDGDRLAQVVGNLVKNALDYSPEDSVVSLRLWEKDGRVCFEVRNQNLEGPIPEEKRAAIFDPFSQSRSARREGLGLGLYISSEIVRAHGGTIRVESSEEKGTVFSVELERGGSIDGGAAQG